MHWILAFPEVFNPPRLGFDALVGNPPFLGGKKLSGAFGKDYRDYLIAAIAEGRKGSADLVSYFFLRASSLTTSFGFLAVNTIAQGDTRGVALDVLLSRGWRIVRAIKTRPWPGTAGVHIAQVWLSRDSAQQGILDEKPVHSISALLAPGRRNDTNPNRLEANAGVSFIGSYVLGMGFVVSTEQAADLIRVDPRNKDVLSPYLTADDLCTREDTSPSRWVINFYDWPIERAAKYKGPFAIVSKMVKPERQRLRSDDSFALRAPLPERWWIYADKRPALYAAIERLQRVIVLPLHSKIVLPVRYPTGIVFSHRVAVVAREDDFSFGVLSSNLHRDWALRYGSTQGTTPIYAPSDCFLTFPFPEPSEALNIIVQNLETCRMSLMAKRNIGMTDLYNLVNQSGERDAAVASLRRLHQALDETVVDLYGWKDIDLNHGFHDSVEGIRWAPCVEAQSELLDRLLELNIARHGIELQRRIVPGLRTLGDRNRSKPIPKGPIQIVLAGENGDETALES